MKRGEAISVGLGTAVAVVLLLTTVLFREFNAGILAGPLPWDDCGIVAQALDRLSIISGGRSLADIALQARSLAPHSPVADIQAMLGLLLAGGGVWGPYVLNGAALLAVALAVGLVAVRLRGALVAVSLLAVLLFQPLAVYSLMGLKADWKSGLFFAAAIYLLFEAAATRERRLWLAGSAFLSLAILCKLTAFYLPVVAVGILALFWLCQLAAECAESPSPRGFVAMAVGQAWTERWALLRLVAICLAPFALFFLWGSVSYYNILTYIRMALSPRWRDGLDLVQRAAFYGPLSNPAWGRLAIEAPLLVAAAGAFAWRRGRLVLHVMAAVGLVAAGFFGLLVVADNANIEFSGSFIGIIVGLTLVAAASLSEHPQARWAVLVTTLTFAVLAPLSGFDAVLVKPEPPVSTAERKAAKAVIDAVVTDVVRRQGERTSRLDFVFDDAVAGFPNAAIAYQRQTGHRLLVDRIDDLPAQPQQLHASGEATFLLVMVPDGKATLAGYRPQTRMPATANLAATAAYVRSLPGFQLVGRYPWKNAQLQLFADVAPPGSQPAVESDAAAIAPQTRPTAVGATR